MYRTYKRKLKLNRQQEQRILSWIGACRYVYNLAIETNEWAYHATGRKHSKYDIIKQLPTLKLGIDWLTDVPAQTLQSTVERLYRDYSRRRPPKWASKKKFKSLLFKTVRVDKSSITILKIGSMKMFKDSPILGTPKTAIVKQEPTGLFVYIQCKDVPPKFTSENQAVGLDMGISKFCVASNGDVIENPRHFEKYESRLRIENRSLARKKKGSNRWHKQAKRLGLLHHKIANARKDFLHKESTKIAKASNLVFVEDLKIANMVRNTRLSMRILDCGWGMFRRMLEYKTTVVRVDPRHTSQICFECGHVDKENRKTQSEFICLNCGHTDNADVNAAKNILSRGTAIVRQREAIACALGEELIFSHNKYVGT